MPAYLQVTGVASAAAQPDPRTGAPARSVSSAFAASPLDRTEPYAVVAVILPGGANPPTGQGRPIDRAGTVQLWLGFDGTAKRKGIRTFARGGWSMKQEADADTLTFAISARGVRFYWTGLQGGDRFGFVSAAGGGCSASGVDARMLPDQIAQ